MTTLPPKSLHTSSVVTDQRRVSELELLYQTSRSIAGAVEVDEVIRAYLSQVAKGDRYACNLVLYEHGDDGQIIQRTRRGFWRPLEGLQLGLETANYERDELDPYLDRGETILINDVRSDPRVPKCLRNAQVSEGRLSLALIPLNVGAKRLGVVVLSHEGPVEWHATDLWPYQTTAALLAVTLQSRLEAALAQEHSQTLAVFEERNRIARELHDSITQLLFSLQLLAQSTVDAFAKGPEVGAERAAKLADLSSRALGEMRGLLRELAPEERSSLHERLVAIVDDLSHHGLDASLTYHVRGQVPATHQHAVARIVQEACSNALRHAKGTQVWVEVLDGAATIRDNGHGFQSEHRGLGLETMAQRAKEVGGKVTVATSPTGTTVTFTFKEENSR